ncbi:MAG: CDGSH iron-sulfur domain-containing protein [Limnothrix sp.]
MAEPKMADKKPVELELEPGKYFYCTCGQSDDQPFCNGSHKGTEFTPKEFTIDEKKNVVFCLCKQTGDAPYCDGSHKFVSNAQEG